MILLGTAVLSAIGLAVAAPSTDAAVVWTSHATADPGLGGGYALNRVSCSPTAFTLHACTAVGEAWASPTYQRGPAVPLVERWVDSSWTIQASPVPAGAVDSQLSGVDCRGGSFCMSVGYTSEGFQNNTPREPLAMSWDGAAWTLRSVPLPAGAVSAELHGVSCTGPFMCKAVGYYSTTTLFDAEPFIASWNGSNWTVDADTLPATAVGGAFFDVSCGDTTLCAAVGYWAKSNGNAAALAESWNGTSWHLDGAANPGNQTSLLGVSCASHTVCFAVGTHSTLFGSDVGFAERRAGATWTSQGTPNVSGATLSEVVGVSCQSASSCIAVAFAQGRNINAQPYALTLNAFGWHRESTASTSPPNELDGISCVGAAYCMTVGHNALGTPVQGQSETRTS